MKHALPQTTAPADRAGPRERRRGRRDGTPIAMVQIPVRCPRCRVETLSDFPEQVVVMALTRWNNMNLYAAGHAGSWSATARELDTIRTYLGEAWLAAHGAAEPSLDAIYPLAGPGHSACPAARLC